MGIRFQIVVNGEPSCVAGIDGNGVVGVSLSYVQRVGQNERLVMHVGGLGRYHPEIHRDCHVHWSVPGGLKPGDEITIRILPAGEFDDPDEVHRSPSAEIDDPTFGRVSYNVSAWDGKVPFEFKPAGIAHFRVHIQAPASGPTEEQRKIFQEMLSRYGQLWPSIAEALSRCHPTLSSVDAVNEHVDPMVCLDLYESRPAQLDLAYTFDVEADRRKPYYVRIRDWRIAEVCTTD